jgi:activator of Hsp90 ATPase-like protein
MTDRIERELELPASPARVWESLTDPELLAEWLADEVRMELRPGGEASFRIGDLVRSGWIEEVRPPLPGPERDDNEDRALVPGPDRGDDAERESGRLTFWWAQDGEPASRVELILRHTDRATTLLRIAETRPLEIFDLVGVPLPGHGGRRYGPALVAA